MIDYCLVHLVISPMKPDDPRGVVHPELPVSLVSCSVLDAVQMTQPTRARSFMGNRSFTMPDIRERGGPQREGELPIKSPMLFISHQLGFWVDFPYGVETASLFSEG